MEDGWLALTPHLLSGIWTLHQNAHPPKLWIDALCINQIDHVEKEGQIPLMAKIYGLAEKTLVWLGDGTEESKLVMTAIRDETLLDSLDAVEGQLRNEDMWERSAIHPKGHVFWSGLFQVFSNPFFTRLWILQEILREDKVDLFMGSCGIPFQTLRFLIVILGMKQSYFPLDHEVLDITMKNARMVIVNLSVIADSLSKSGPADAIRDCTLLLFTRDCCVTEPVDNIYALYSMFTDHTRSEMAVDYSEVSKREYWRVYTRLGISMVKSDYTFFHFLLAIAESTIEVEEMPSWCPNWNSPKFTSTIETGKAGFSENIEEMVHTPLIRTNGSIQYPGFELDRIKHTISLDIRTYGAQVLQDILDIMLKCECLVRGKDSDKRLARTLIANSLRTEFDFSERYEGDILGDYIFTKNALLSRQSQSPSQSQFPHTPFSSNSETAPLSYGRYMSGLQDLWHNRSFFVTENGLMGLCSARGQVGDAVVVFLGADLPSVLRERSGDPDDENELPDIEGKRKGKMVEVGYRFVCEAYVDGVMDGEAFEARDVSKDREFVIF